MPSSLAQTAFGPAWTCPETPYLKSSSPASRSVPPPIRFPRRGPFVRDRGGDPFSELTLPEALIKFRQGVGRLIRTQTDRGLITVFDRRILAKSYGRLFIEGLPQRAFVRITRENRHDQFRPFKATQAS